MHSPPNPCHKKHNPILLSLPPWIWLIVFAIYELGFDYARKKRVTRQERDAQHTIRVAEIAPELLRIRFVLWPTGLLVRRNVWLYMLFSLAVIENQEKEVELLGGMAHGKIAQPQKQTLHHTINESRIQIQQFIFRYTFMDTNILDAHHVGKLPINEFFSRSLFSLYRRGSGRRMCVERECASVHMSCN